MKIILKTMKIILNILDLATIICSIFCVFLCLASKEYGGVVGFSLLILSNVRILIDNNL